MPRAGLLPHARQEKSFGKDAPQCGSLGQAACEDGAMFVKICGLSEPVTLAAAVEAGANAVGFVFAQVSPRTVAPEVVRELVLQVPAMTETVGVFRNQPIDKVIEMARIAGVRTVQLHGGEPLADFTLLQEHGFDTIRALSVDEYVAELERDPEGLQAHRLLLDAPIPGAGIPFDPAPILSHRPGGQWLLAGGLTPANVRKLVRQVSPGGVDVSSGVESSRGVKDVQLIRDFIAAVR